MTHDVVIEAAYLIDRLEFEGAPLYVEPGLQIRRLDSELTYRFLSQTGKRQLFIEGAGCVLSQEIAKELPEVREEDFRVLDDFVRVLRIFFGASIQPLAKITIVEGREDLSSWDDLPHYRGLPDEKAVYIHTEQVGQLERFWRDWNSFDKTPLEVALSHLEKSIMALNSDERLINLVYCLESLLSEAPGDIRYKVAMRGAYLMREDASERPRFSRLLRKLYDARSAIVHGRPRETVDKIRRDIESMWEATFDEILSGLQFDVSGLMVRISPDLGRQAREVFLQKVDESMLTGQLPAD